VRFAYFPGCKIPRHLPAYDDSTRAVLRALDVDLVETGPGCCGYPVRHRSFEAAVYSAARVLAAARQLGLPLLTPCMCCYGSLRHAEHWLREHPPLRRAANRLLAEEGLEWAEGAGIHHLLSVLHDDIGPAAIRSRLKAPLKGLRVAAHYGCHALRPARIVCFDNPLTPARFEALVEATGAAPLEWPARLECCGNPAWGKNDRMAGICLRKKIDGAAHAGADRIATACTYCQLQFGPVRRVLLPENPGPEAVLFTRLLGEALGIDPGELGAGRPARAPDPTLQIRPGRPTTKPAAP
jgi:heterodisulfide reductase subunit B